MGVSLKLKWYQTPFAWGYVLTTRYVYQPGEKLCRPIYKPCKKLYRKVRDTDYKHYAQILPRVEIDVHTKTPTVHIPTEYDWFQDQKIYQRVPDDDKFKSISDDEDEDYQ